jgi:hypothetical protein
MDFGRKNHQQDALNRPKSAMFLTIVMCGLLGFGSLQVGCGEGPTQPTTSPRDVPPPTPTPPTPPVSPASTSVTVSGHIVDFVYRPLAEVKVEVIEGSGAGAVAITNASGDYALPGVFSGNVTIQASKPGYVTQTQTISSFPPNSPRFVLGFLLDTPSENFAGNYTLTITADPAMCADLPPETRSRTYEATATLSSSTASNTYNVFLRGATFAPSFDRLFASVSNNAVRFSIDPYSGMVVTEQLTPTTALIFSGDSSVVTIGAPTMSVPFVGQIEYCPDVLGPQPNFPYLRCGAPVQCSSSRHTLTLTRR